MNDIKQHYTLTNLFIISGAETANIDNGYITISDGIISAVGNMDDHISRQGEMVYDCKGYYVMPGLVDAHIHLAGGRGSGIWGDTEILAEPEPVRSMRSVYEAQKMLRYGFTTLRDISWNGLYLKRIFGDQVMPGPRIVACGPGLARTGGHCDSPQFPLSFVKEHHFWAVLSDGTDECRKNTRRILREGADQIKFWATGGGNWDTDRITDTHYSFEEMKVICDEAHMIKGTMVCAHCETAESIAMAIRAGADTIEHGEDLTEDLAEEMAEKDIILVPTLYLIANWYDFIDIPGENAIKLMRPDPFLQRNTGKTRTEGEKRAYKERVINSFQLALKKGVKIALGSDTVYEPSCEYGQQSLNEYLELIKQGMSISGATTAATLHAAQACGMDHIVGSLEAGKAADFIILHQNPLIDEKVIGNHENLDYVVLNGQMVVDHGRLIW